MKTEIKNISFILLILLSSLLILNSCHLRCLKGNGSTTTETRSVSNFNELQVSSALKVIYSESPTYKVEVVADDNLIGYITTEVHGNELQIGLKHKRCFNKATNAEIHVSAPSIDKIEISGASQFETTDTLHVGNLNLKASGASKILIKNKITTLTGEISGASVVETSGNSTSININASGASVFNASNLQTKIAIIDFSGSSTGTVNVINSLAAELSGASTLNYYGNPTVNSNTSGSSNINKK